MEQSSTSYHHQLVDHSSSSLYIFRFWLLTTSFSTILIITNIHTHRNNLKVLASHFWNSSEILYSACPALMDFVITNDHSPLITFILSSPVLLSPAEQLQLPSFQLIYSWISMATVTHWPPETSGSLPALWSPLLPHPILPSFPGHVLGIAPSHNSGSQHSSTWWRPLCSNPALQSLHTGTTASDMARENLTALMSPLKVMVRSMSVPVVATTPSCLLSPLKSPLSRTSTVYLFSPHKHRASIFLFQLNVTFPSSRNNIKQKEENEASTVGHAEALTTWTLC